MSAPDFDVVVVGARCAGAALATFLARDGVRVLAVDRDPLPSDQVLSTHTIHPPGVEVLDELGVGDAMREVTPRSPRIRLVKGDAAADLRFDEGRAEYCPRRKRLDGLLQEAAVAAGATLEDRTKATEVLFEDRRAVGVRLASSSGTREVRAALVVGADGRRSTVAEQVGAEEYLAYDTLRAMYWGYWEAPREWRSERYPFDMYLARRDEYIRSIFQTDDGQLLIAALPSVDEARAWRHEPLEALRGCLERDPVTAPLVRDAEPDGQVRGTLKEHYFFRRAAGPGWALVGDAGHHKDFVIGDGITEALLQAKSLARAVGEGTDGALVRWWRERDVEALPLYYWAREEGTLGGPGLLETAVIRRVAGSPELTERMSALPEHRASPYDVLPASPALRALAGLLLRGRLEALSEFLARGRRAREYARELEHRKRLLAECPA